MTNQVTGAELAESRVEAFVERVRALREGLHRTIVGQDQTIDLLLTCALIGSHALLVGVPGLAKTLMVKTLAAAFHWKFARIQFTPDLMPADITGYELLGRSGADGAPTMTFRPGPVWPTLRFPPQGPPRRVPLLHGYYQSATTSCRPSRRTSLPSFGGASVPLVVFAPRRTSAPPKPGVGHPVAPAGMLPRRQ